MAKAMDMHIPEVSILIILRNLTIANTAAPQRVSSQHGKAALSGGRSNRLSMASSSTSATALPAYGARPSPLPSSRLSFAWSTDSLEPPEYCDDDLKGLTLDREFREAHEDDLNGARPADDDAARPCTPPSSVFLDNASQQSTPSAIAAILRRAEEDETELSDGPPDELDLLLAKTTSILASSSSCLASMIESREHLRRFYALDSALDRYVTLHLVPMICIPSLISGWPGRLRCRRRSCESGWICPLVWIAS